MKKILMLMVALMTMATLTVNAQNNSTEFEITKTVSAKLQLEDNMVVKNATKLFIDKITVIYKGEEIASAQYLYKGDDKSLKKYEDNALAQFRGEELTVKIVCKEAAEAGVALDAVYEEDDDDLIIKIIVPKKKK
ncbi:MAG: hypothetical protein J6T96_03650 [Bacteroidales bacterium]|nr:hypothetical protein [Bacteroidales bacterium]MBO7461674.1 hypothetical protein [Bacteroidales bacterium]